MPQLLATTCQKMWIHLMRYLFSYDFKRILQCKTSLTTFCNCFVCGQSTTQQKKNTNMVLHVSIRLKSYLENYYMKTIPLFC